MDERGEREGRGRRRGRGERRRGRVKGEKAGKKKRRQEIARRGKRREERRVRVREGGGREGREGEGGGEGRGEYSLADWAAGQCTDTTGTTLLKQALPSPGAQQTAAAGVGYAVAAGALSQSVHSLLSVESEVVASAMERAVYLLATCRAVGLWMAAWAAAGWLTRKRPLELPEGCCVRRRGCWRAGLARRAGTAVEPSSEAQCWVIRSSSSWRWLGARAAAWGWGGGLHASSSELAGVLERNTLSSTGGLEVECSAPPWWRAVSAASSPVLLGMITGHWLW
jgi:hypothetical protein